MRLAHRSGKAIAGEGQLEGRHKGNHRAGSHAKRGALRFLEGKVGGTELLTHHWSRLGITTVDTELKLAWLEAVTG